MMKNAPLKNPPTTRAGDKHHSARLRISLCASMFYASTLLFSTMSNGANNKQQLDTVQQSILVKEKNVQQQQKQRSALLIQLKEQKQSITNSTRALRNTVRSLEALKDEINELTRSIQQLQNHQAEQKKLLEKQLDAAFRQGQHSGLQFILNNEETLRKERILAYFSYLNKVHTKTINNLHETSTDLTAQKRKRQEKQRQQQQVLQLQQKQKQTLRNTNAAREKTLFNLNLSIAKDNRRLIALHQNETRLHNTIAHAELEARDPQQMKKRESQTRRHGNTYQPSETKLALVVRTSGLGRPTGQDLWPLRGRTLHHFGELRQGELHYKGLVIAAPEGNPVKSIAAGRVLMADWLQGYGMMVVIEHGRGDMSLYGYNQSSLVNVGDQVKAGQPIALVGTNGDQGSPSLYFEIRRQGQAVNPIPWLGR